MGIKQNQSVYIPSLHPVLWDSGFTSIIYYSIGKTAKTLKINPNAIRNRIRRGTITCVKINHRFFVPTSAIRMEKTKQQTKNLPADDLSLLMMMEGEGENIAKDKDPSRTKEYLDLEKCFVVAEIAEKNSREIFVYKRVDFELAPNRHVKDCLVCSALNLKEEQYREMKNEFLEDENKALEKNCTRWQYYKNVENARL